MFEDIQDTKTSEAVIIEVQLLLDDDVLESVLDASLSDSLAVGSWSSGFPAFGSGKFGSGISGGVGSPGNPGRPPKQMRHGFGKLQKRPMQGSPNPQRGPTQLPPGGSVGSKPNVGGSRSPHGFGPGPPVKPGIAAGGH